MMTPTLDAFTRAYLECALFCDDPYSGGGGGEWFEHDDWTIDNIAPESIERAIEVCRDFQDANRADLDEVSDTFHKDDSSHGHDFWLTRNGHGAGFWDRGYGTLGRRLSDACKPYGEAYVSGPETTDQGNSTPEQLDAWDKVIYIND
jgi:hypothetical protein